MDRYFNPEIETASREYLWALQSARLIKMVHNAYNHVPFYQKKFDEIGLLPGDIKTIDDITKLPFTVKQDLRDNYPFGLFAVPKDQLVRIHASSGTTGKQTVVGYTQNDIDVWAEGAAEYPQGVLDALEASGADITALDALAIAMDAGSSKAVNVVLMGVLAQHMDLSRDVWDRALEETVPPKFLEMNKLAFSMGYDYGA